VRGLPILLGSGGHPAARAWAERAAEVRNASLRVVQINELLGEPAQLIVVASGGHGRVHDAIFHSPSMDAAMRATCPVVVVTKPDLPASRTIVAGVDGSPLSLAALDFAVEEAELTGMRLLALHAWLQPIATGHDTLVPLATDLDALQAENEAILSESLAGVRMRQPDLAIEARTVQGMAATVLTDASKSAALLVIGSHGRGPVAGLLIGSVSQAVLHHSHCPVAVIHAHREPR
jgi:nucleotide-binding universal stress UspA family protein